VRAFIFTLLVFVLTSNSYANDTWMPHIAPSYPVVEVPLVPSVVYSTRPNPTTISYGWVPYRVDKAVLVEKRCLFYRYQYIVYQPSIEWVYQPVLTTHYR
jgi:hypothetical protein